MPATRILFVGLIFLYFVLPVAISEFIFDNTFYIYSSFQSHANAYSLIYGLLFGLFIIILFKASPSLAYKKVTIRLKKWRGARFAYYAMVIYSIVLLLYGMKLRLLGSSREDLLSGMDDFLLPGMSMLLLFASVFAVCNANRAQFYGLFALFLAIDVTFNGKIFSFLALILFFARIDYIRPSRRAIIQAFTFWFGFGLILLFLSGLTRISLAGDDLNVNAAGIAYLFGSEFLGVQASIGWGMDYFNHGQPFALWNFGSILQEFYITNVGHGLATSPGAFFQANFGVGGPFVALLACLIGLVVFRASARWIGFVAYLIIAINFQHFLRHGIDVFLVKILSQMIFAILVAVAINPFGNQATVRQAQPLLNS